VLDEGATVSKTVDEMQYLVLAHRAVPYLLARVRWPDVAQAMSAACPDWLDDPGLFDLPYDSSALALSFGQAASIAAAWGVQLSPEPVENAPSYIRRMPANWSDLSPSERRAWGIELVGGPRTPTRRFRRKRVPTTDPVSVASEQRHISRVQISGRAHIREERITLSVGLVDLSDRGAGCVTPTAPQRIALAPGTAFAGPLLFELESDSMRICLDVTSWIVWSRNTSSMTHFGISFAELAENETEGVQRFLAATRTRR
jgi:hypothetical protein